MNIRARIRMVIWLFLFIFIFLGNSYLKVYAEPPKVTGLPSEKFLSNLSDDELNTIWSFKVLWSDSDITRPFEWIKRTKTFIVAAMKERNKKFQPSGYYFNAPNPQNIIFSRSLYGLPNGYLGLGINPDKRRKNYPLLLLKKDKDEEKRIREHPKTKFEKYGYGLPNPIYVSEYPRVDMTIGGVVFDDGETFIEKAWDTIKTGLDKIRKAIDSVWSTIFGNSLIPPPDQGDLMSLNYLRPHDYVPESENSLERWIGVNLESIKKVPDGQILVRQSAEIDENGKDKNSEMQYIKGKIFNKDMLSLSPENMIITLKKLCKPHYHEVMNNLIAAAIEQGASKAENLPMRIMPYDVDSLVGKDRDSLIRDPRCSPTIKMVAEIPFDIDPYIMGGISNKILEFGSDMSELSLRLNNLASFDLFKEMGFDLSIFYDNAIITPLLFVLTAGGLILIGLLGLKWLSGNIGALKVFSALGTAILLSAFLVLAKKGVLYNNFIEIGNKAMNFSVNFMEDQYGGNNKNDLTFRQKTEENIYNLYFSFWSEYHTGYPIGSKKAILDKENGIKAKDPVNETDPAKNKNGDGKLAIDCYEPEVFALEVPKAENEEFNLWGAVVAESVTKGHKIKNDIYRVVDHYMAPRVEFLGKDNPSGFVKTTQNENYNGRLQDFPDLGALLGILIVLFVVVFKLICFIDLVIEILLLPCNVSVSLGIDGSYTQLLSVFKRFGLAFLKPIGVECFLAIILRSSMMLQDIPLIVWNVFMIWIMISFISKIISSRSLLCPRSLIFIADIVKKGQRKLNYAFEGSNKDNLDDGDLM